MASTSTQLQDGASLPSGSSSWKYDVFLSFRGTDTRNGFVDHLFSALHQKCIFTFKDDQKLERGESISSALLKAIEESRFAVVVFSENYASSKWCLEELVKVLECQRTKALTVLPVFYKVDPSDLRKQRGSVGEAFAKHEQASSKEEEKQKVQRWRNAILEAANISGWDLETHGPEAKLIRNIAIDILNRLGDNGSSALEDVVGLHPRISKVMSLLEMGLDLDDPRIVGICGMGGIGKTTIAKVVYHQIRSRFHASCYLPNVREAADGKHGLESLQKSLLVDIHSVSDSDIKIRNIDWPGPIRNAVRNKRVLVVLDDIDHSDQLDALVGRLDWFGPGSRIILTTRDKHLLARYGPKSYVYNVEGLNDEEAFKLFCCKAFRNKQPTPGFAHLIKSAVDYAKGVPLALTVLGCFLIGRKVNEWQSAIHKLRQEPNPDIQKVLKLSYDGLGGEEQEIFLDIACFFKWYSEEYSTIVNILDACGFHADIGISVLKDKALVMIRHNKIDMHDLIQEIGWHIVNEESLKEPGRRSRLWKYKDIYHTLTKKICLDKLKYVDLSYSPCITKNLDFTQVANLKELILEGCTNVVEIPSIEAIKRLAFLNLRGLEYLKVLSTGCWLKSLKKLVLSGCSKLKNISEVLAFTECLIELDLDGTCVKELPVEHLTNLQFISLRDCKELTSLPNGICGLKLLASLIVSGCSKLSKLPENIGGLERLRELRAGFTAIKQPPSSIMHLKELRVLSFMGCKGPVTSTPWNSLFSSFLIRKERQDPLGFELPAISGLRFLFSLDLRDCNFLEGFIPNDLGSLSSLEYLHLSGTNIISLPASVKDLYRLRHLGLRDCKKLKALPYLPTNIVSIDASGCTSLETLPNLAILPREIVLASLINCHTLVKNRPNLPLELLRNYLKKGFNVSRENCTVVVPGREIPKCFSYQNNMGHYVRIQLMPNWYQRLRAFVVCAVFEAKAPSIDAEVYAECYAMLNDVEVCSTKIDIFNFQFQSCHLFLDCMAFETAFRYYLEANDLKKTEIIFYFKITKNGYDYKCCSTEMFAPIKCAVHMVYENDKEWLDPRSSIQQSDCDEHGSTEWMQGVLLRKRSRHDYDYKADTGEQPNPKRLRDVVSQWRDS